jgi:hypothetical protein
MENYKLYSNDNLTKLAKDNGVNTWNDLKEFVKKLPYGRNENRTNFELVLSEKKGTCSSKHALLKKIADNNKIPNIELVMGIYKMNDLNTPKIGDELTKNLIEYIPEAHCYLKIKNQHIDLTSTNSEFKKIQKFIIHEKIIEPEQVGEFKVKYHKNFIKKWINDNNIKKSFEEVWETRENCIKNLSK